MLLQSWFDPQDDPADDRLRYMPFSLRRAWEAFAEPPQAGVRDPKAVRSARFRWMGDRVREMQRAGVVLLAGTDAGSSPFIYPGFAIHDELRLLVESAGLTPLEALRTATLNPARFLGATDSLGGVTRGRRADLVLLDGDPLRDIRNTRRINAVIANGRLFDRAALDSLLSRVEAIASR